MTMPAWASRSRIASAASNSLAARADWRACELVGDEHVEGGEGVVGTTRTGVVPYRRERVDPEHLGHGDHCRGGLVRRVVVAVVERGVAGSHRVVHDGQGAGHVEVVVHGLAERRRQHAVGTVQGAHPVDAFEEPRDPLDGGAGLDQ